MSLAVAPPESASTSAAYCPTNVEVLESMAKFKSTSSRPADQQPSNTAPLCHASEVDNSNSSLVSRGESNESDGAVVFQPVEVMEAKELGAHELEGEARITPNYKDQEDIFHAEEFSDGHLQLASTPTRSQTISNESQFLSKSHARPPAGQLHGVSSPAIVNGQSCQGCKALQVSTQRMETEIYKLSQMVTELNERIDQMSKQKAAKSSVRQSDEVFTDKRLMRVKAAALITGRPLSAHMCKQLVYERERATLHV